MTPGRRAAQAISDAISSSVVRRRPSIASPRATRSSSDSSAARSTKVRAALVVAPRAVMRDVKSGQLQGVHGQAPVVGDRVTCARRHVRLHRVRFVEGEREPPDAACRGVAEGHRGKRQPGGAAEQVVRDEGVGGHVHVLQERPESTAAEHPRRDAVSSSGRTCERPVGEGQGYGAHAIHARSSRSAPARGRRPGSVDSSVPVDGGRPRWSGSLRTRPPTCRTSPAGQPFARTLRSGLRHPRP